MGVGAMVHGAANTRVTDWNQEQNARSKVSELTKIWKKRQEHFTVKNLDSENRIK